MAMRRPQPTNAPPTLTPQRGIELLKKQIIELDRVATLRQGDPAFSGWTATTEAVLKSAFGFPNDITNRFKYTYGPLVMNMTDSQYQKHFVESMQKKRAILMSAIEQLEILAPPAATVATGSYVFHAEIERVSSNLFRDAHYKQAALEAYIRVIEEVKTRSALPLDGDNLMNHAFGCDGGKVPVLKFNSLATDADKDEQRGFMYLLKGIVAHRNLKAHSNRLFDDPLRAHDYLSLASLLMRALELTTK
jgi:uncharacterized protein (TIGR02391 family)